MTVESVSRGVPLNTYAEFAAEKSRRASINAALVCFQTFDLYSTGETLQVISRSTNNSVPKPPSTGVPTYWGNIMTNLYCVTIDYFFDKVVDGHILRTSKYETVV